MANTLHDRLCRKAVEASAPCRIDMGGTLDLPTFYYPLRHLEPCTVNLAINLRTRVRLLPYRPGWVKVSSRGFESAAYPSEKAPFDHPLGLVFAVAAYFRADGVHIEIESASPPRSALGGSSAAGVALVAAFGAALQPAAAERLSRKRVAVLAHALEQSVAAVPCGRQDQLAAAYGGVHAWNWHADLEGDRFSAKVLVERSAFRTLTPCMLLAYCGIPHESRNINGRWVKQFLSGQHRTAWHEICRCTRNFRKALTRRDLPAAVRAMNREVELRREMTPDVLDPMGEALVAAAVAGGCGARFTGAGGGGCIWAIGPDQQVDKLAAKWETVLSGRAEARRLDAAIDDRGVAVEETGIRN